MGLIKGGALRLFQTFLYGLLFLCAGIILGFFSYFLSVLADRNTKARAIHCSLMLARHANRRARSQHGKKQSKASLAPRSSTLSSLSA